MHTTPWTVAAALLSMLLLAPAVQAQKLTPGLWEHSVTLKGATGGQVDAAMAQMQDQMARMTPEQRAQVEAMMAQRGIKLGGGAGKPTTVQVCITPEQAARDDIPAQADSHCKQTSKERSGNTLRFKFACAGERPTSGEGDYTFISDKQHKGHMTVDTAVKGKPERLEMDTAGRWLGADCGAVKPRG